MEPGKRAVHSDSLVVNEKSAPLRMRVFIFASLSANRFAESSSASNGFSKNLV
jgi:hypothetical protein